MNTQLARCRLEMYFPNQDSITLSARLPIDRLGVNDLNMDELARRCMATLLQGLHTMGLDQTQVVRTRIRVGDTAPLAAMIAARNTALDRGRATHTIMLESDRRHDALTAEFDVRTETLLVADLLRDRRKHGDVVADPRQRHVDLTEGL